MTASAELARIEKWIYTLLRQDGTVTSIVGDRIYTGIAPTPSIVPYIVYYPLSPGEDTPGTGATRIWAQPLYLIKAVTTGNSVQPLQTLVDLIDTLFHGQKGGVADTTIHSSIRERPYRSTTVEPPGSAIVYQHLGGEYRIRAAPTVNP
jgi:hypothetical protein